VRVIPAWGKWDPGMTWAGSVRVPKSQGAGG
jgi:hypothetical protein